ncbi:MAG: ABC transporter permease [Bacillota bacterium]
MIDWTVQVTEFLAASVRLGTPVLICALGLIFMERSGMVNIGAEGMMLVGCLAAVTASYLTGNPWLGALVAMACSGLVALLFAYLTITVKANQVVIGAAINLLGLGLTTTLFRSIFGIDVALPKIGTFGHWTIPYLVDLPIIGPALFKHGPLVYLGFILVPISHYILFQTTIGLKVRAVGEHPRAADTVGINVFKVRYATTIAGGILAGLAGAHLAIGMLSFFTEDMVAGRGFIALAAVIFGKWTPFGALGAALFFGAAEGIMFRGQAVYPGVPSQLLLMLPYVLTVAAIAGLVGRATPPAAAGNPYAKE